MPTIETLINPIKLSDVTSLDDNDSDDNDSDDSNVADK